MKQSAPIGILIHLFGLCGGQRRNEAERGRNHRLSLEEFATECEPVGMRIRTFKSETMVYSRKKVAWLLRFRYVVLCQVEEFEYLGFLFMSEGRIAQEIGRRYGAASAVMRSLRCAIMVKKELSRETNLCISWSIYVLTLTYSHELWVVTEKRKIADTNGQN
ncbi:uncharacterized protein LOC144199670 [Stigmatopora nigra]